MGFHTLFVTWHACWTSRSSTWFLRLRRWRRTGKHEIFRLKKNSLSILGRKVTFDHWLTRKFDRCTSAGVSSSSCTVTKRSRSWTNLVTPQSSIGRHHSCGAPGFSKGIQFIWTENWTDPFQHISSTFYWAAQQPQCAVKTFVDVFASRFGLAIVTHVWMDFFQPFALSFQRNFLALDQSFLMVLSVRAFWSKWGRLSLLSVIASIFQFFSVTQNYKSLLLNTVQLLSTDGILQLSSLSWLFSILTNTPVSFVPGFQVARPKYDKCDVLPWSSIFTTWHFSLSDNSAHRQHCLKLNRIL